MKFDIILIIIGFINTALSNITVDDYESVCIIPHLRRKRAQTEYTRWRPSQLTTQEFIVKVFDEELTTSKPKQVVAINIQPLTKETQKVIEGGIILPSPTTVLTLEQQQLDYTRFIPPTTVIVTAGQKNTLLAQAKTINTGKIPAILPKVLGKNEPLYPRYNIDRPPLRDESPPIAPLFLARTSTGMARQYAPIVPVAFTRRPTITYLTPRVAENMHRTDIIPTRTSPLPDVLVPKRTSLIYTSDLLDFRGLDDEELKSNDIFVTRSSISPIDSPYRTHGLEGIFQNGEDPISFSTLFIEDTSAAQKIYDEGKNGNLDEISEKDIDSSYNMLIYSEDDILSETKKKPQESNEQSEKDGKEIQKEKVGLALETESNENKVDDITDTQEFEISTVLNITSNDIQNDTTQNSIQSAPSKQPKDEGKRSRKTCSLLKLRQLNFHSPRTLPEIVAQLKQWVENSPLVKWVDITAGNYTVMENPIYMMIIDDPSSGQIVSSKQTVMVIAGIQGRDHHAVSAALYVLYQLIERSEAHTDLLAKYRFWIIPVFNPDGYDYSMTFPQRREWTKNLRQTWESTGGETCFMYGLRCSIMSCFGVNLDRNFEYQWIPTEELHAEHPCGDLYAGPRQLSEAETRALTHHLHNQRVPLNTFVAFKEGDVLGVMYPYSHTRKTRAFDHVYRQRASAAASAAYGISGRPYVAGQTSQFLPLYAGGIEDWVDGHLGIDNTYTIMMFRPSDSYNSKLAAERVVHEAYAALDTLLLSGNQQVVGQSVTTLSKSGASDTTPHRFFAIFYTILIFPVATGGGAMIL